VHLDLACSLASNAIFHYHIIHRSYPILLSSVPDSPHSHLLPLNRRNHLPSMPHIPKLQIPYPLPRARIQPPIRNRNRHARAHQRGFNMCLHHHPLASPPQTNPSFVATHRHIIAPLGIMPIQSLPAPFVLGHNAVQRIGHVGAHV
jgi:hypothetical protein